MASNQVLVKFAGDSSSLESALKRLDGQTATTQSKMQKFGRTAKIVSAAVLGGLAIAFKAGFDELKNAQQVTANTDTALAKFGGTAKITTKSIQDMSSAIMQKSGVDDEQVQSMANLLLANQNFRSGLGSTTKGVESATMAALDWSVATGKDSTSAAMALNKALANPTKGVALLEKAGIAFTASEKAKIKAMVESGDVAGAQAAIIKKLEGAYGGAATAAGKTLAGELNVAKESFLNLAASVVSALLPAFNAFAGVLTTVLGWLSKHETMTKVLVGVLAGLAVGVLAVNAAVKVFTASMIVVNAVMAANPVGLVVLAIAALAAGLIIAWKNSETFRNIVTGAFNAVKSAVDAVVSAVRAVIGIVIDLANNKVLRTIGTIIGGPFLLAITNIERVRSAISSVISAVRSAISAIGKLKSLNPFAGGSDPSKTVRIPGTTVSPPFGVRGATGGIVTRPTMALIGEAGPEAVVPLNRTPGSRPLGGGGGGAFIINVYDRTIAGMSPDQRRRLAEDIAPELRRAFAISVPV